MRLMDPDGGPRVVVVVVVVLEDTHRAAPWRLTGLRQEVLLDKLVA